MLVEKLMTHPVEVVQPDTTLREAAEKMRSLDIGALPVCSGERVVGVLTDRDLVLRAVAEGLNVNEAMVEQVMSSHVTFCYTDQDAAEAELLMQERKLRRLAVFDREERLVGIISLGDLATRNDERCGVARTLELVSNDSVN